MPMTMLGYAIVAENSLELIETPIPVLEEGEILCKTLSVSICTTDYQYYCGLANPPHHPIVTGHEYFGEICENRSQISTLVPGTRIVYWGQTDFNAMAEYRAITPVVSSDRSSRMFKTDRNFYDDRGAACSIVPNDFSFDYPSLAEPLTAVMRSIYWNPPKPGDNILVLGAGSCGLLSLLVFRAMACARISVVEMREDRRALAVELGADSNFSPGQLRESISASDDWDKNQQIDYVFDTLPTQSQNSLCTTRELALQAAREEAQYIIFGANTLHQKMDLWSILAKGIRIKAAPFDVRAFPMWRTAAVLDSSLPFLEHQSAKILKLIRSNVNFSDSRSVLHTFENYSTFTQPKTIVKFTGG